MPISVAGGRGRSHERLLVGVMLAALLLSPARAQVGEENSPQPESPEKHGFTSRAVPELGFDQVGTEETREFVPLLRLTTPYYDNPLAVPQPAEPQRLDPSTYRPVTAYTAPLGLQPPTPPARLVDFHPFATLSESYDSNIRQTANQHVGDFFLTPRAGADLQVGSADSVYSEGYDTILGLKAHGEIWGDIFSSHHEFDALDGELRLDGRIGRGDAIWRPFLYGEDVTGTNLISTERLGRIERQRLATGVVEQYRIDQLFGFNQTLTHGFFEHPDPSFIDFETWQAHQEVTYRMFRNIDFIGWNEVLVTDASRGADGHEYMEGVGLRGKFDPRLFSEILLGWDSINMTQGQPDRADKSGLHLSGHTSFEWGPRLRLVLQYNRTYVFNETTPNDNYTASVVELAPEIFLGGNWYVTPYFGISYDDFETSHSQTLEVRPELEVAYLLPSLSRLFVKVGYDKYAFINGSPSPVETYRFTTGFRWRF